MGACPSFVLGSAVCASFCLVDRKRKAQQQQQWQQQQLRFANTKLNWATLANVRHVSINPTKSTFWPCLWHLSPPSSLTILGHFLNGSTGFGGSTKNANNKFISISQESHRENKKENNRSSCINQFPYNCSSGWQREEGGKRERVRGKTERKREKRKERGDRGWRAKHFIALFFVFFPFIFLLQLPTEALPQNKTATTTRSEIQFALEMKTKIEITIKPVNAK